MIERCPRCDSADLSVTVNATGELWVFRCVTCGHVEEHDDTWLTGVA